MDDSVADSEVAISNYSVHSLDRRNNRRGGGVALYLLDGLKYTRRKDLEEESETIWIQVQLCNTKFLIGCVYRAPDESLEVFDYMDDVLRYATRNKLEVIILGDMNCDCLNTSLKQTVRLQEFFMVNELEQLIKEPSRVTCNTKTLIDVLITSTPGLFKTAGVLSTTLSDHHPIYGIMNGPGTRLNKHQIITTRSWKDNSIKDFVADLQNAPWSSLDSFDDVDDMYSVWESLFKSLIDSHFPLKRKRLRKQTHPWLDSTVLCL